MIYSYLITLILCIPLYIFGNSLRVVKYDSKKGKYFTSDEKLKLLNWQLLSVIVGFLIPIANVVIAILLFVLFMMLTVEPCDYKSNLKLLPWFNKDSPIF